MLLSFNYYISYGFNFALRIFILMLYHFSLFSKYHTQGRIRTSLMFAFLKLIRKNKMDFLHQFFITRIIFAVNRNYHSKWNTQYNQFWLFAVVMFNNITENIVLVSTEPLLLGENRVRLLWTCGQQFSSIRPLFYVCFYLKTTI